MPIPRHQLGIIFSAAPLFCGAVELPEKCGSLPQPALKTQEQAIWVATQYLQMKSEACPNVTGYAYAAKLIGSSWVVQVIPAYWENNKKCTGDTLDVNQQTGQLNSWKRISYQNLGAAPLPMVPQQR